MRYAYAAALIAALPFAAPASAQIWDGGGKAASRMPAPIFSTARERNDLDRTIRNARKQGQLSRDDARSLRRENRQIGALEDRYGEDGISASEEAELTSRSEALRGLVSARRSLDDP